jgi:hypothetical protein
VDAGYIVQCLELWDVENVVDAIPEVLRGHTGHLIVMAECPFASGPDGLHDGRLDVTHQSSLVTAAGSG